MWVAVPSAAAIMETFLGWLPLLQVMELRRTAVQIQRDGFQIELFEEAVAVWDATSEDEQQPSSKR